MNKSSFFIVGKHAVIEALKNPNRKVLRVFLTEKRKKTIHRENQKKKGLEITAKKIAKTWFVKKENAKYFDVCIKAGKQTSIKAADDALIAFKNWNGVDTLKNIKNETLIVWGDQDKSYNLEQIQTLEKNIVKSKLVIFKNCAHNVHLEQPEQFNKTIRDYLKIN